MVTNRAKKDSEWGKLIRTFVGPALFVFSFCFLAGCSESPSLRINEVCTANTSYEADNGCCYDFVEIYNYGTEAVKIGGFGLTDRASEPYKFRFPQNTVIEAGGYIVVFCDREIPEDFEYGASFGLSSEGETVVLVNKSGAVVSSLSVPKIRKNNSYGVGNADGTLLGAMPDMTPGRENKSDNLILSSVDFDTPSGFYESEFDLSLSSKDGYTILYTLDGSIPTFENANVYKEAIHIYDRSGEPNIYSAITDISTYGGICAPLEPVDKAMIVRAVTADSEGHFSDVVTKSYFVGYDSKADYYKDTMVVSLVADPDDLFGSERGIYVTGDELQKWIAEGGTIIHHTGDEPANYLLKGAETERRASVEFLLNGTSIISNDVGIRIKGGATRSDLQKSLNIYSRSIYGEGKIEADLFDSRAVSQNSKDSITSFNGLTLRNGGNDSLTNNPNLTRFVDKLNQTIVSGQAFATQTMRTCIVFINGEYWGQYELMEKYDGDYIESHYGVNADDVCIIKIGELDEGTEEDFEDFQSFYEWAAEADFSDDDVYDEFFECMDLDSYLEYTISEVILGNGDWGCSNYAMWRYTGCEESDNPYMDGKWRFLMFDTDFGGGALAIAGASDNNFTNARTFIENVIDRLAVNDRFREAFSIRFMDILNDKFNPERVNSLIDSFEADYYEFVMDYIKRFYADSVYEGEDYGFSVQTVRDFFENRADFIAPYMAEEMALEGEPVNVKIFKDSPLGTVLLNSITPDLSDGMWSGVYYTDFPIMISIDDVAEGDYAFFELSDGTRITDNKALIYLSENTTIKVVYLEKVE